MHRIFIKFSYFSKPRSGGPFSRTLRRSRSKSVIFNRCGVPAGVQKEPFEHNFRRKRPHKITQPSWMNPPGADLGAIWRRKRAKDAFPQILVPLGVPKRSKFPKAWRHARLRFEHKEICNQTFHFGSLLESLHRQ